MIWQLFICFAGVFISFLLNGYVIEIITTSFGDKIFNYYVFMVLVPAVFNALYGKVILLVSLFTKDQKTHVEDTVPKSKYFLCSVFQMCSMLCANASLAYINYPTQLVLKSSKPIVILLFSLSCLSKKKHSKGRILSTFIIVFGVMSFMYQQYYLRGNSLSTKQSKQYNKDTRSNNYIFGCGLVFLSLFFDGLLAITQEEMRYKHVLNANLMMYRVNAYSSLLLFIGVLGLKEFPGFVEFFMEHPSVAVYLFMLGLTSAVGQSFIYYTVTTFGPLTCSIITTSRKFFQIFVSVIIFLHIVSVNMWLSVFVVFFGLVVDIWTQYLQNQNKTLAKLSSI